MTAIDMKWRILPKVSDDLKLQLLHNRGLDKPSTIDDFFQPTLEKYSQDLALEGIVGAKKRILSAIKKGEVIVIYGDYDVDGISASTIVYKGLTSLGATVFPFIPHRDRDGYGLSISGLDTIKQKYPEVKLVITVDNGIVAIEQANYAKKMGLDLIITDHHLPLESLPDAVGIVHSTKLCGAGVAWCLMREMVDQQLAAELLQFVAIGTIADQMSLVGLGRALVVSGLEQLNQTTNPGLRALITATGLESGKVNAYEIGHILAPKLNAAGRVDNAMPALKLLCTSKSSRAAEYAQELMSANSNRQDLTVRAIEEASSQINMESQVCVVYSQNWISGIIGLVAARLCEEYNRPAVAIAVGETVAKGSARSVPGVNIVDNLRLVRELLIDVGGHSGAAGFSLDPTRVEEFKTRFEGVIAEQKIELTEKELEIEAEVPATGIKRELVAVLNEFEPFGSGNPKPVLASRAMKISDIKTVGNGKHLKFRADGIDAIAFSRGELANILRDGQLVDLAYQPEINRFNGRETLQLKVKDVAC